MHQGEYKENIRSKLLKTKNKEEKTESGKKKINKKMYRGTMIRLVADFLIIIKGSPKLYSKC